MNKNVALTPPMGWNSWDCFGAAVTEAQLMQNAEYMRDNLLKYGWEYVVCDIQWYEPDANSTEYRNFVPLETDEYSRLVPAVNRFPSAANGVGFKKIADEIHAMGLKFGIHIMRGVPRQAVHANTPIKGSEHGARGIAQRFSVCSWNTDMYGIDPSAPGAQDYYNSIFELYAEWGVDLVKVDDICNTFFKPHDIYSAKEEIEMIRIALDRCNRPMVLSLSPGPADVERADHLAENANMWRITGDFWDNWDDLYKMFERCEVWSRHVKPNGWPDCDMLPLGHISIKGDEHGLTERYSRFTSAEKKTLMTLWCIFRSPLMFGGHLPDCDEETLSLLTNPDVLKLLTHSSGAKQIMRTAPTKEIIVWKSYGTDGEIYIAVFNAYNLSTDMELSFEKLGLSKREYTVKELWSGENLPNITASLNLTVDSHGCVLLKLVALK